MSSGPERPAFDHRDEPVWTSAGPAAPIRPIELRRTVDANGRRLRPRDEHVKRAVADPATIETK